MFIVPQEELYRAPLTISTVSRQLLLMYKLMLLSMATSEMRIAETPIKSFKTHKATKWA